MMEEEVGEKGKRRNTRGRDEGWLKGIEFSVSVMEGGREIKAQ